MAIETLDDIAEEIADGFDIYGACPGDGTCSPNPPYFCRCCFVAGLKDRMREAVKVERAISAQEDQTHEQ